MNKGFVSHVDEVLAALEENRVRGFEVVGNKCADYAAMLAPVDTGRLKNSIIWATTKSEGRPYTYKDDNGVQYDDHIGTGTPTDGVAVGTNVEYAVYQEKGTRKTAGKHYLERAMADHMAEYREILKQFLQGK